MNCKDCKHYVTCIDDGPCSKFEPREDNNEIVIDPIASIQEYIHRRDWRVHENANMPFSFANLLLSLAGKSIAEYWLNVIYHDLPIKEMHKKGFIHVHDLGLLTPYCFTGETVVKTTDGEIKLEELFEQGTIEVTLPIAYVRRINNRQALSYDKSATDIHYVIKYVDKKDCVKIELEDGTSISVSKDHAVLIKRGDKFLLTRADEIDISTDQIIVAI